MTECNFRAAWGLLRFYYFLFLLAKLYYFIRNEVIYAMVKFRSNFKVFATVIHFNNLSILTGYAMLEKKVCLNLFHAHRN